MYFESPAVGLLGLRLAILSRQPLDCWGSAFLELPAGGLPELLKVLLEGKREKLLQQKENMSDSPVDEMEVLPQVSVKPLLPTIPTDDKEYRELREDLRAMGCGDMLIKPWNVESEYKMREFLFLRGNQWDETPRRDPENWTPDTWCTGLGRH